MSQNKLSRIFYIADTHFGHKNIIAFDHRPFRSVQEMNETMIKEWNKRVSFWDKVYILGDFSWLPPTESVAILNRLQGAKFLIKGNHDVRWLNGSSKKLLAGMWDYKEIRDRDVRVFLSHYPNPLFRAHRYPMAVSLYGHVHKTKEYDFVKDTILRAKNDPDIKSKGHCYNVGCMLDYMDYGPRTLDEILLAHQFSMEELRTER